MSVLLIGSSFVTTHADPGRGVSAGAARPTAARSRISRTSASATVFGTIYDISTISILWFAGASAMAGLLNLVPRYLPRYGMAPEWARATRPLVLIFTAITFLVTILFDARRRRAGRRVRDRRAGADELGRGRRHDHRVAAVAPLGRVRRRSRSSSSTRRITNIFERPEGIKIASVFIAHDHRHVARLARAALDRAARARHRARRAGDAVHRRRRRRGDAVRIIANRPDNGAPAEYDAQAARSDATTHHLPPDDPVLFLEVRPGDASEFSDVLTVAGRRRRTATACCAATSPAIPERDRRAAAVHPRPHRPDSARLLRLDRRQPDHLPAEVPGVRRGRHRAGHARSAAPVRVTIRSAVRASTSDSDQRLDSCQK